jgi:hypothetical protein
VSRPLTVLLAAGAAAFALVVGVAPASAAPTPEELDQSRPAGGMLSSLQPATDYDVAQPFEPTRTAHAERMTVAYWAEEGVFASAALHAYPRGGVLSPTPVTGGVGTITASAAPAGISDAEIAFPDRPLLEAGVRYALVLDATSPLGFASLGLGLDGGDPELYVMTDSTGTWAATHTGRLFFSLWTSLDEASPLAPTASCSAPDGVAVPSISGLSYAVTPGAGSASVTATALPGFAIPTGQTASWTIAAPTGCATAASAELAPTGVPVVSSLVAGLAALAVGLLLVARRRDA